MIQTVITKWQIDDWPEDDRDRKIKEHLSENGFDLTRSVSWWIDPVSESRHYVQGAKNGLAVG